MPIPRRIPRKHWPASLALLCLSMPLWPPFRHAEPAPSNDAARFGRYTRDQILARAEPLCDLALEEAHPRLETETREVSDGHGEVVRYWDVSVTDARDKHLLSLRWNADTGQLWRMSSPMYNGSFHKDLPLPDQELALVGERWLRLLWGPRAPGAKAWPSPQVDGSYAKGAFMRLVWQTEETGYVMHVDKSTGRVVWAHRSEPNRSR